MAKTMSKSAKPKSSVKKSATRTKSAGPRSSAPAAAAGRAAPRRVASGARKAPARLAAAHAAAPVVARAKGLTKSPLSKKEMNHFRERLLAMRESMNGQISALKGASLERRDKVITEEDGTDAFDRDFALNLASSEQDIVFEIDEALRRIEQQVYGVCEMTGRPIEKARLEVIPYTRMCVEAQSDLERGRARSLMNRATAARSLSSLESAGGSQGEE